MRESFVEMNIFVTMTFIYLIINKEEKSINTSNYAFISKNNNNFYSKISKS